MVNLERLRMALVGAAAGLLFSSFYIRGANLSSNSVSDLRDVALLLLILGTGLSIWFARSAKRQRVS